MYKLSMLIFALTLAAFTQTRVDIQRQGKGLEFLSPPFDRPVKSGAALPLTCAVNDLFLLTTAAPGANLHVCHAEGQWVSQGSAGLANVTVMADGEVVGTTTTLNLVPAEALSQIISVLPGRLNVQQSVNTAVLMTNERAQAGENLLCASSGGNGVDYSCEMLPRPEALTVGMVVHWRPDVANTSPAVTLSIGLLGPTPVRLADGVATPRVGDFQPDAMYLLWYDGTQFRVFQAPTLQDFLTVSAAQQNYLTVAAAQQSYLTVAAAQQSYQTIATAQAGSVQACESPVGPGNAYACPVTPAPSAYSVGMRLYWRPAVNSTGGETTLTVNALEARPLKLADGVTDPSADELVAGQMYAVWYDGAQFRLLDFLPQRVALRDELRSSARLRCASTGTVGQDFTCQMTPTLTAYAAGLVVHWVPDADADGSAVTLAIDGLAATAVKRSDGTGVPLEGEFLAGTLQPLWFDGVDFRLVLSREHEIGKGLRPVCDATLRGKWWFLPGDVGVADEMAVCAKDDLDAYAWRTVYP